jgi:hypothetical protein
VVVLGALLVLGYVAYDGATRRCSRLAGCLASGISFELGGRRATLWPDRGPYDIRLGYAALPELAPWLDTAGLPSSVVAKVAHERARRPRFLQRLPGEEPGRLGAARPNGAGCSRRYPRNVYADFAAVLELVARTLLYVEDRERSIPRART